MVSLLVCSLLCGPGAPAEWPQWRGPNGDGTSRDAGLPVSWKLNDGAVRWRTTVPGEGASSPVVRDGKVFITSAYPASEGNAARIVTQISLVLLSTAMLVLVLRSWWRDRRFGAIDLPVVPAVTLAVHAGVLRVGTLVVLAGAVLVAFEPERLLPVGEAGRVWRVSGGLALGALVAGVGGLSPRSRPFQGGCLVVLAAAAYVYLAAPLDNDGAPIAPQKRGVAVLPGIVGVAWCFALSVWTRRLGVSGERFAVLGPPGAAFAILLSLCIFIPSNFIEPRLGMARVVLAYDLEGGDLLWETVVLIAPAGRKHRDNSYATPTPCAGPGYVVAHFGPVTAGLNQAGRVLWRQEDPDFAAGSRHGAAISPIIRGGVVYVAQEREDRVLDAGLPEEPPSYIAAYNARSGRELWRVFTKEAHDSYATPVILERAFPEILLVTSGALLAHDAESGERLWDAELPLEAVVPTAVASGGRLIISGGRGPSRTMAFMLEGEGRNTEARVVWESRRDAPTIPSPLIYRDLLFTLSDGGALTCIDLDTGGALWRERLPGRYAASLVAADGKVYATSRRGLVSVVAAKPIYELLGRNELEESCVASPAIAGRLLIFRTEYHLIAISNG